jgi:hypothetical protein
MAPHKLPTNEAARYHLSPTQNLFILEGSMLRERVDIGDMKIVNREPAMRKSLPAAPDVGCQPKSATCRSDNVSGDLQHDWKGAWHGQFSAVVTGFKKKSNRCRRSPSETHSGES